MHHLNSKPKDFTTKVKIATEESNGMKQSNIETQKPQPNTPKIKIKIKDKLGEPTKPRKSKSTKYVSYTHWRKNILFLLEKWNE